MSPSPPEEAPEFFFGRTGESAYQPTYATTSPWDESAQHGGPPSALLATCIDDVVGREGLRLARLSVDFLRPIPRREFTVHVDVTRPGRRVCAAEATLLVDAEPVVRATSWHIATGPPPPQEHAEHPDPPPALPGPQQQGTFFGLDRWGHGEAIEWRFVTGGYDERGRAAVWTRLRIPLLADRPLQGYQRALMVADSTNGLSNVLPLRNWLFIPPALTVTLLGHPVGEWVFLDARTTLSVDGQGIAQAGIYDQTSFLGTATQPLLVSPR